MPVLLSFRESRARQILDSIRTGQPIPVGTPSGYTQADLIQLAGACMFAAIQYGPTRQPGAEDADPGDEQREAEHAAFMADMPHAVNFAAELTFQVEQGEYGQALEEEVQAWIFQQDGRSTLAPVKGFKSFGD